MNNAIPRKTDSRRMMSLHPVFRSHYRRGRIGAILLALFCSAPAIPGAEELPASSIENDAAAAYYSGNILGAVDLLQKVLAEASAPPERVRAHLDLVHVCSSVRDYECFVDNLAAAFEESGKIDENEDHPFPRQYFIKQLAPWLLYQLWWGGEYQKILDSPLAGNMNQTPVYEIEPINYLTLQATLVRTYYLNYNTFDSRKSITRMINYIIISNYTGRNESKYMISRYLLEIIRSLYIIKDSFNSYKYVRYFDQFILDNLPAQSIENIEYLALSAEVIASEPNPTAGRIAIARIDYAHDLLEGAKIDDAFKRSKLSYLRTLQATIALGIGQIDDAYRYHLKNPLFPSRDDIIQQGSFASNDEFYFAIADLYSKRPVYPTLIEVSARSTRKRLDIGLTTLVDFR